MNVMNRSGLSHARFSVTADNCSGISMSCYPFCISLSMGRREEICVNGRQKQPRASSLLGCARAALEEIPALIGDYQQATLSGEISAVQTKLDDTFSGDLMIADKESLDGFFALKPSPGLFQRLHESFDYVTDVLDNPAGTVRVTGIARFHWCTYGELMEWYHSLRGSDRFGAWSTLTPFFVCGNTGVLHSYTTKRWARAGLSTPAEEPSKWFVIRPGLPDAEVGIRLAVVC
jgi:hypothetical protein